VSDSHASSATSADGMPNRLSMVVLSARDLPALRRFYVGLGWPERPGASDEVAMFELESTVLTLHPARPVAAAPTGADGAARAAVTLVVNVDRREAVDEAVTAALELGATVVFAAGDQPWGGRSAVVADPEGNRWEVLWVSGAEPTNR
jgi:uncharacterized protein